MNFFLYVTLFQISVPNPNFKMPFVSANEVLEMQSMTLQEIIEKFPGVIYFRTKKFDLGLYHQEFLFETFNVYDEEDFKHTEIKNKRNVLYEIYHNVILNNDFGIIRHCNETLRTFIPVLIALDRTLIEKMGNIITEEDRKTNLFEHKLFKDY